MSIQQQLNSLYSMLGIEIHYIDVENNIHLKSEEDEPSE